MTPTQGAIIIILNSTPARLVLGRRAASLAPWALVFVFRYHTNSMAPFPLTVIGVLPDGGKWNSWNWFCRRFCMSSGMVGSCIPYDGYDITLRHGHSFFIIKQCSRTQGIRGIYPSFEQLQLHTYISIHRGPSNPSSWLTRPS